MKAVTEFTSPEEAALELDLPLLGSLPSPETTTGAVAASFPHDADSRREYYHAISRVLHSPFAKAGSIGLVGDVESSRRAHVASWLAASVAAERSVILVDADLRGAHLSFDERGRAQEGLVDVLRYGVRSPRVVSPTRTPGLNLLPVGSGTLDLTGTFGSGAVPSLFEELRRTGDLIVINGPALSDFQAAAPFLTQVSAWILLHEIGHSDSHKTRTLRQTFGRDKCVGIITLKGSDGGGGPSLSDVLRAEVEAEAAAEAVEAAAEETTAAAVAAPETAGDADREMTDFAAEEAAGSARRDAAAEEAAGSAHREAAAEAEAPEEADLTEKAAAEFAAREREAAGSPEPDVPQPENDEPEAALPEPEPAEPEAAMPEPAAAAASKAAGPSAEEIAAWTEETVGEGELPEMEAEDAEEPVAAMAAPAPLPPPPPLPPREEAPAAKASVPEPVAMAAPVPDPEPKPEPIVAAPHSSGAARTSTPRTLRSEPRRPSIVIWIAGLAAAAVAAFFLLKDDGGAANRPGPEKARPGKVATTPSTTTPSAAGNAAGHGKGDAATPPPAGGGTADATAAAKPEATGPKATSPAAGTPAATKPNAEKPAAQAPAATPPARTTPPATPPVERTAPVGTTGKLYFVHVSSLATRDAADLDAARMHRAGFPTSLKSVELGSRGTWWRVYLGPYGVQGDADAAAAEAKRKNLTDYTQIYRLERDEVEVGTGQENR